MAKKKYSKTILNITQNQYSIPVFAGLAGLVVYWFIGTNRSLKIAHTGFSAVDLPLTDENTKIPGAKVVEDLVYINIPYGQNLVYALAEALNHPAKFGRLVSKKGIVQVAGYIYKSQYPAFAILFELVTDADNQKITLDQAFAKANKNIGAIGTDTKQLFINNLKNG